MHKKVFHLNSLVRKCTILILCLAGILLPLNGSFIHAAPLASGPTTVSLSSYL